VIRIADRFAQREVSRQHDVLPSKGDEQGALRGPWADAGYGCQLHDELLIRHPPEALDVQSAIHKPGGEIPQRVDLAPRKTRRSQVVRISGQHLVGRWHVATEKGRDTADGSPCGSDGELLSGHLKEERPEQVHRREFVEPRERIEVRPLLDQLSDHWVDFAQIVLATRKARCLPTRTLSRDLLR
jgi:hypothetical protein